MIKLLFIFRCNYYLLIEIRVKRKELTYSILLSMHVIVLTFQSEKKQLFGVNTTFATAATNNSFFSMN